MPIPSGTRSYPNRYPGDCVECETHVPEWSGTIARTGRRQNNGRLAFEVRCISCGGWPEVDQRLPYDGAEFTETHRPMNPSELGINDVPAARATRQCTVQDCTAEPLGLNQVCARHRDEQQAERDALRAERQARVAQEAAERRARLLTTHDLGTLPRPSRDRLHVYGARTADDGYGRSRYILFRIWMQRDGSIRIYGTTNGNRSNYRTFPDLVAIQGATEESFSYRSDEMRTRYVEAINAVMANPNRAVERWGLTIGHCGHCGRTLTNPESVARGIGPVCYSRMLESRWRSANPGQRICIAARCREIALDSGSRCQAHQRLHDAAQATNPTHRRCVEPGCPAQAIPSWTRCAMHQRIYNAQNTQSAAAPIHRQQPSATVGSLSRDELGQGEIL